MCVCVCVCARARVCARVCVCACVCAKTVCVYRTYSHLLVPSSLEVEAHRPVRVEGLAVPRRAPLHVVEVRGQRGGIRRQAAAPEPPEVVVR